MTEADCAACRRALDAPDSPWYQAQCIGCAVRSLAQGPQFHAAGLDGGDAKPFRKALALIFGDDWRAGYTRVVAEHERIKRARAGAALATKAVGRAPEVPQAAPGPVKSVDPIKFCECGIEPTFGEEDRNQCSCCGGLLT